MIGAFGRLPTWTVMRASKRRIKRSHKAEITYCQVRCSDGLLDLRSTPSVPMRREKGEVQYAQLVSAVGRVEWRTLLLGRKPCF